jgi:hypothetical protein
MARRRIEVEPGQFVTLAMDDPFTRGMRLSTIVEARLLDDSSGLPVTGVTRIVATPRPLSYRVAGDGFIALVGRPAQLFPRLDVQSYAIEMTIYAPGYQAFVHLVTLPVTGGFPNTFTSLVAGDLRLLPL